MSNKIFEKLAEDIDKIICITEDIIFPYKGFDPRYLYRDKYSYRRAITTLENKKLIKKIGDRFSLTLQGKLQLITEQDFDPINDVKKWDSKWRIIAFDIPESNRRARNLLRKYLSNLGFKPIQKSIWITPLKIEYKEISDLFDKENDEKIFYVVTRNVSDEKTLKKLFNLE